MNSLSLAIHPLNLADIYDLFPQNIRKRRKGNKQTGISSLKKNNGTYEVGTFFFTHDI